tara:strand:+ start:1103 stop:1342 length:240 start_codon:yes stop_codon:yes gene_type:complete
MFGINAKLPKRYFSCTMCSTTKNQELYIWGSFPIPPEHPYKEYEICKKCAIREHGKKSKNKLENIIDERTQQWKKRNLK